MFCGQSLSNGFPTVKLRQKGSDSINKVSKVRESKVLTKVDGSMCVLWSKLIQWLPNCEAQAERE